MPPIKRPNMQILAVRINKTNNNILNLYHRAAACMLFHLRGIAERRHSLWWEQRRRVGGDNVPPGRPSGERAHRGRHMAVHVIPSRWRRRVRGSGSSGCDDIGRRSVCRRHGQGNVVDDWWRHTRMLPSIGGPGRDGRAWGGVAGEMGDGWWGGRVLGSGGGGAATLFLGNGIHNKEISHN
jgi:hypothetical protein